MSGSAGVGLRVAGSGPTLVDLVSAYARRRPDAVAVTHGTRHLTYGGLDRGARLLAGRLRDRGVGPESVVGLCQRRSPELLVSMLGVLAAGGAYLPMDPDYPAERLRVMAADTGPVVVLADDDGVTALAGLDLPVERVGRVGPARPAPDPTMVGPVRVHPDNLAYVMHTSGSTGRPKGVAITHRGVVELVVGTNFARFGQHDRVAQTATASFDASTLEVWGALLNGGTVVIVDREQLLDPAALVELLTATRVTVAHLTTALVERRDYHAALGAARLRYLLFGGDKVSARAVSAVLGSGFDGRLVHLYGPTETTVLASHEPLTGAGPPGRRVPIGRPVARTELYVLDHRGHQAPVDLPGELVIGGPRLARGYLGAPGATAARFVPSTLTRPGGRVYRTGDLARFLPDGRLEFRGRLDDQVKVRGFRVEPAEVENHLGALPGVSACAVLVRPDPDGVGVLVGYVVPAAGGAPDGGALRTALREGLPEHLVPSVIEVVDQLPLSPNGKVDRVALAAVRSPSAPAAGAAPRSPLERTVAEAVAGVLGRGRVGRDDDFFELGGHSLAAVRLVAELAEATGHHLPVGALFRARTVAAIAAAMTARPSPGSAVIRLRGNRPGLALVHPVGGGVLCYGPLVAAMDDRVPVVGVEARAPAGPDLGQLALSYLDQLTGSGDAAPLVYAGWSVGGVIAFEMARLARQRYGVEPAVLMIDSVNPATLPPEPLDGDGPAALAAFVHDLERASSLAPSAPAAGSTRAVLADLVHRMGGSDSQLDDLTARFDIFRSLRGAFHRHRPRAYSGPVHLVQPEAGTAAAGWRGLAAALAVHEVGGDHYSLVRAPAVAGIARLAESLVLTRKAP